MRRRFDFARRKSVQEPRLTLAQLLRMFRAIRTEIDQLLDRFRRRGRAFATPSMTELASRVSGILAGSIFALRLPFRGQRLRQRQRRARSRRAGVWTGLSSSLTPWPPAACRIGMLVEPLP